MTDGAKKQRAPGFFGWLRAVDDGVFAVEQAIVAIALIAITVLMFVNVVARRIQAQDSKIGAVIAKIGGVTDLDTRAWIDANVAPWVTLATSFALFTFGYYTWRRFFAKRKKLSPPPIGPTLGVGALVALACIAAGWGFAYLFLQLESKVVFAGLFGAASAAYGGVAAWKRPRHWQLKTAAGFIGGGLVVWFCLSWFPIGYTWTSKVSLMLLLWVGMLAASVCVHEGKHIRMEALGKLAPERVRRYLTALGFVVAAAFCGLMTWLGVLYTFEPVVSTDEYMPEMVSLFGTRYAFGPTGAYGLGGRIEGTDIPDWAGAFSVVVGFGLATLRFAGAGLSWALGGDYGAAAPEEGLEEARQHASGEPSAKEESSAATSAPADADDQRDAPGDDGDEGDASDASDEEERS